MCDCPLELLFDVGPFSTAHRKGAVVLSIWRCCPAWSPWSSLGSPTCILVPWEPFWSAARNSWLVSFPSSFFFFFLNFNLSSLSSLSFCWWYIYISVALISCSQIARRIMAVFPWGAGAKNLEVNCFGDSNHTQVNVNIKIPSYF